MSFSGNPLKHFIIDFQFQHQSAEAKTASTNFT